MATRGGTHSNGTPKLDLNAKHEQGLREFVLAKTSVPLSLQCLPLHLCFYVYVFGFITTLQGVRYPGLTGEQYYVSWCDLALHSSVLCPFWCKANISMVTDTFQSVPGCCQVVLKQRALF